MNAKQLLALDTARPYLLNAAEALRMEVSSDPTPEELHKLAKAVRAHPRFLIRLTPREQASARIVCRLCRAVEAEEPTE